MSQSRGGGGLGPVAPLVVGLAVFAAYAQSAAYLGLLAAQPELPGRPNAEVLTGAVSLLAGLTGRLAAAATLGLLAAVVAFVPRGASADTTEAARATLTHWTLRAAQLWLAAALVMTFANPTFVLGLPLRVAFVPSSWWTFITTTPSALAWLVSALVALATVLASLRVRSPGALIGLWLLGAGSTLFVAVTGNVTVGLDHDFATDAMTLAGAAAVLVGSAAVAVVAGAAAGVDPRAGLARYVRTGPLLVAMAAGYAVVAWQQLAGVSPLDVAFGMPVVFGFAVLALLVAVAVLRALVRPVRLRLVTALVDLVLLVIAVTSLNAAEHLPPPRFMVPQSIQINYLGYEVLEPANLARVAGLGRPNLLWTVITITGLALYAVGMVRARRLGHAWPVSRPIFFAAGMGLTGYLAVSGLWEYSTAAFSWHMLVHMTINMMIPVLCVLGAPFELLRAASRPRGADELPGAAQLLDDLLATRVLRVLTSAPVVWAVYVFSLFGVYFSPLFPWLMRYHWGHQAMLLFFMMVGFGFFNLLLAPGDGPGRLPYVLRFALLISVMPFHAMFAVGIMSSRQVIGEQFYAMLAIPWVPDLLADQNVAGQITWFTGEVPAFIAVVMLAAQWFRSDSRAAAAADRHEAETGDADLSAYNDMLAELAARDASAQKWRHDDD
ncbi:MAG: cytochrome c oxidase assembly protein [Micropruina sp.]|nr:cytochrome c oxidase assembly protein [Micropruina sp.]